MIARLLMSDILDCIAANPKYFLLWTLSREASKLAQRLIFFFIFIFVIKQFLIEKIYLEKTAVENILWAAPYLFLFGVGTLAVSFMRKYSRKAQNRFNVRLRAPIFQKYHNVPRIKIVNGLRYFVILNIYLFINFVVCWVTFGTIFGAIIILAATALMCIALFVGTRQLTSYTTALFRMPLWNLIEGMVLIIYYIVMMWSIISLKVELNVSAMIFIILIPRQLISSLVRCAQSYAFCHTQRVATLSS